MATNELIAIYKDDDGVDIVDARELHAFLEVGKDFSTWIKDRIAQYNFMENQDFWVFTEIGENSKGGRPTKEYVVTVEMAKELSMVERNEKGKQARLYFLECERRLKEAPVAAPIDVRDPKTLVTVALQLIEVNKELEARAVAAEKIADEAKEDQAALATIAKSDGSLCLTDAAKSLQHRPSDLIAFLKSHGWIYRRAGGDHWIGYQARIQDGDLEHKIHTILQTDGRERICEQVRITPQGLAKLAKLFPPMLKIA